MSKMYKCPECDCNYLSSDIEPETLCKWCAEESPEQVKIKDLEGKLVVAKSALEFYESAKKYHGHESSKYGYIPGEIINDNGDTARGALAELN